MRVTLKYLRPHPKTGIIQYRRRVPKDLAAALGRGEIVRSLGTRDLTEAVRRAKEVHKEWEKKLAALRKQGEPRDLTDLELYRQTVDWLTLDGTVPAEPQTKAEEIGRSVGIDLILGRYERKLGREPEPKELLKEDLFKVKALAGTLEEPPATIRDALRIYVKDKGTGRRNEAEQLRFVRERERAIIALVDTIGNKPIRDVTRDDARRFREAMVEKLNTPGTVNNYIKHCRTIFGHAIRELELARANPFEKLQLEDPESARDKRDSFTDAELKQLVKAARTMKLRDDMRHILLMLADTGARLNEIVGLERGDIVLDDPVPHVLIRPNSIRLLKTDSSKRRVPLIGVALEAAREAVGAMRQQEGQLAVFPAYTGGRGNTNASGALMRFLRERAKITDPKLTIHSLRHTFKDRMRNAGVPEDVRDYLQGHTTGRVSEQYGEGPGLEYLAGQLAKVAPIDTGEGDAAKEAEREAA